MLFRLETSPYEKSQSEKREGPFDLLQAWLRVTGSYGGGDNSWADIRWFGAAAPNPRVQDEFTRCEACFELRAWKSLACCSRVRCLTLVPSFRSATFSSSGPSGLRSTVHRASKTNSRLIRARRVLNRVLSWVSLCFFLSSFAATLDQVPEF